MPRLRTPLVLATAAALVTAICSGAVAVPASASASAGPRPAARTSAATITWDRAVKDKSVAALDHGSYADVQALSCGAPGNCAAGGKYVAGKSGDQAFVMNEVKGRWDSAEKVPGMAALPPLNDGVYVSTVTAISCASAGNCTAGGWYTGTTRQSYLVTETHGTWGAAFKVPGTNQLSGGFSQITNISCPSPRDCSAAGRYTVDGNQQVYVVSEVNGTWGDAEEVPGLAALNAEFAAEPISISCPAPGDCSLGGLYASSKGMFADSYDEPFVVNQVAGTWKQAEQVPGFTGANIGGAHLSALSCYSAGNCTAAGVYLLGHGGQPAFVASEVGGTWGKAHELPRPHNLFLDALSCPSAGNCSAAGYMFRFGKARAAVASEKNGTWEKPEFARASAGITRYGYADAGSVSCWSAGNCSAVGVYGSASRTGSRLVFVLDEAHGVWGKVTEMPGTAALNVKHRASVTGVACIRGTCTAAGEIATVHGKYLVFVDKTK